MKIVTFVLFTIALTTTSPAAEVGAQSVTQFVRTGRGFVGGLTDGKVDQFLGVPYAAPPVGDLRWKAPAAVAEWHGVRDATKLASECTQPARKSATGQTLSGSEDCLYLNIYRPAAARPSQLLPVLVFIDGGSNQKGAGNDYDASEMVASTGIIVVTVNYRLNVFGFLALPSLDAEAGEPSSGNFGLLDQQAAMRWVRANILEFGGNPLNVTIDGESAGGIDMCANLVSPQAAGLFSKVILESVYCPSATHDEALKVSNPVATALGCTDSQTAATCMRAKAPADVLKAAGKLSVTPGSGAGFNASPNVGNSILPLQPLEALAAGKWNRSSILIGQNHDEAALFVGPGLIGKVQLPLTADDYARLVTQRLGSSAQAVLDEYPAGNYSNPFMALSDLVTDPSPLGCPVSPLAQLFSSLGETFRYEFDDPSAPVPGAGRIPAVFSLGAYHGSELQYLFKMTLTPGPKTEAQKELSSQMIQYWANFAKTGNPNGPGLVDWPRFEATKHQLLSLRPGGNVVIDNFDAEHHCAFWNSVAHAPAEQ